MLMLQLYEKNQKPKQNNQYTETSQCPLIKVHQYFRSWTQIKQNKKDDSTGLFVCLFVCLFFSFCFLFFVLQSCFLHYVSYWTINNSKFKEYSINLQLF